jgi:ATP-dependent Clp protease ATP-binding subunit ClpC
VFERYTEKARRVIFFARYEASQTGSRHIETEHLLLGIFREDHTFGARVGLPAIEAFRKQVEAAAVGEKIATSVDLPLSHESKRVLAYAAEECEEMRHKHIEVGHLVLGLLRLGEGTAVTFLKENGIQLESYREIVRSVETTTEPAPVRRSPMRPPQAASLAGPVAALYHLLDQDIQHLNPDQRLKRKSWTRKEVMGRLVDLATAFHQWLARALAEPRVASTWLPPEEWVTAQQYAAYDWRELISLWLLINRLLMHDMCSIPEVQAEQRLPAIRQYVAECEDLVGQILSKLD